MLLPMMAALLPAQGLPPLIDREILFGNPEISGAQISPDGKYLAFIKPWKDTRNVWVKKTGEPFSAARLMTTETKRPVAGFLWSRDSKYLGFVKDHDGDENFNLYAVDPAAAVPAGAEAPPARDLTGLKGVRVQLVHAPKTEPGVLYVGINDRDKAWHDLYKVNLATGEKTLIRKNTDRIAGWEFDVKDQLRLAERSADSGETEILRVDANGFNKIYSCEIFETCGALRFHKDGKRVYLMHNKGGARPGFAGADGCRDGQARAGRVRPAEARRLRRRPVLRAHRRSHPHFLRGRQDPRLLQRQGIRS
jgi:hypothetical protein